MGDFGSGLLFLVFALFTVFCAYMVVSSKHIVHSAIFLALTFVGVAVLYLMLNADFLAAVQVLVYGGAVSILIVFGIMLTLRSGPSRDVERSNENTRAGILGAIMALVTFIVMALVIFTNEGWRITGDSSVPANSVSEISWLLLSKYVIPFEVAAILLLVAMVGAIILAKGADDSK
ncbi:MAG TPA: NADH-quinone oxidoreductase subunit J [Desulfobacteria bacterium]|nr:NADH-quinone oxidoreductase subunit J [Desulfobacteria bacterium]